MYIVCVCVCVCVCVSERVFHVTSYSELNSNMHVGKLVLCVCIRAATLPFEPCDNEITRCVM